MKGKRARKTAVYEDMACEKEVADTTAFVIRESEKRSALLCLYKTLYNQAPPNTWVTTGCVAKLAAIVGYSESGARKALLKIHSEIVTGEDEPGIKRKRHTRARKVTDAMNQVIGAKLNEGFSSRTVSSILADAFNLKVSHTTVVRAARRLGASYDPYVTISQQCLLPESAWAIGSVAQAKQFLKQIETRRVFPSWMAYDAAKSQVSESVNCALGSASAVSERVNCALGSTDFISALCPPT